ncbi:LPS export ABC transporter permease LptG [Noviherbaspirillum denitrificans]|uniref:LPS export ABC transporter permease LptG n=1 Tax=Noviherbaspirillum denitrificans TaxID=1968433 RepID=A0A254TIC4_9BURK|nr:LPS export ABC transporter permease LptG [Noviherbaspirillum denitrificans]OWW22381.1 LPS export ABC transporter permease LptG [Noviherbaspirillum denitrificans]
MRVLDRYVSREVTAAVAFALVAFLALFAFFDLIGELPQVGRGGYELQHAFLYVAMGLPGYVYDLMPIAALIGTIYALAQLAARSEFTIMRASGLSTGRAGWMLAKVGIVFVLFTFLFGEVIAPASSEMGERLKLQAQGSTVSKEFRTGLWTKDVIRQDGVDGEPIGSRFLNVADVTPDGQLQGVKMYEFDRDFHLTAVVTADRADYRNNNTWRLANVTETVFPHNATDVTAVVTTRKLNARDLVSEITPDILSVLFADPDRMSAYGLATYTRHLAENKQTTERYEIAFWKKLFYPLAVLVMMALALPFAYLHFRAGGVSLKIFIGIMIGVSFQLLNSLFSHLGLLNTWPPLATAVLPSATFLLVAIAALLWVQKH